jgi:hypothetical protein
VRYRRLGLLAAGAAGLCVLATARWVFVPRAPGEPGGRPDELAAAPAKSGPDPFGFSAAFDAEVRKLGQITPRQFADRYPAPAYLAELSWDPTTARFFDKLNVETVIKESPELDAVLAKGTFTPEQIATIRRNRNLELPGYKLTADELAAYRRNGFVVSERLGGYSFGQVYYDVYTRDLPVFVTSDSVLHAWHRSYDAILEELERTYLMPALDALLAGMHDALPDANTRYGGAVLKESVLDADYFLAVARSLLKDGRVPTKLGQEDRVQRTLIAVANEGMHEFTLFGRGRNVDFSQFKPRGRYEAIPELRRYFKAMMWCGRTDLRIAAGYDQTGRLSSPRELGSAAVLLDLLRRAGREEAWRQFDRAIQTFVGRTDSATFDDLARVTAAARINSPEDLKTDTDLARLAAAVQDSDAGKQDVRGDVFVSPHPAVKVTLPRSFTVLGQKFVLDSWATSKVVFGDIMWDGTKVVRRVPSGLDVAFAALGNSHVVPELVGRIEGGPHRFRDGKPYQHNLAAVRAVIDGRPPGAWDESIYTSWLKTLRTLPAPTDAPLPEAMRTRGWAMKQTNTQLASWAQLRHDTVLYVKQSYTSGAFCYYPAGYVEPVVPFWAQMEATARRSADLLERTPFPAEALEAQKKQVAFLRKFAAQMTRLKAVAEKQLAQQELTADERKVLEDVMQIGHQEAGSAQVPKYTGWYPALFYRGPEDCIKWDALVADVHTDVPSPDHGDPGCVLHQGVGGADLLVIAVDNGTDRVVYAGPTFSHYEFEMPGTGRKTDAEWKADLLDGKVPPRPDWTRSYLVPVADRKPADQWTRHRMLLDR